MKVLIVAHYLPPHVGGIEQVVSHQAKALTLQGAQVKIISSDAEYGRDHTVSPLRHPVTAESVTRVRSWNGIERNLGIPYPLFGPSLLRHVYHATRWATVVHVHDSTYISSIAACQVARSLGKPMVLTQHVGIVEHPSRIVTGLQQLAFAGAGNRLIRNAKAVVAINTGVQEFAVAHGALPGRTSIIPNGVDETFSPASAREKTLIRRRYGLPPSEKLVLYVGRFVPKKGFDKLQQATAAGYKTVFVGGAQLPKYDTTNCIYLGLQPQTALAEIYRACDLFVAPSTGEGFTLTILEAMASGLPVITSDDDRFVPRWLDRTKVRLIEPTVADLRVAITDLIHDEDALAKMRQYSLYCARRIGGWEANATALLEVYNSVVKHHD